MPYCHRSRMILAAAALTAACPAWSEAPMNTDDAGTLARGGMKIEGIWSRDDQANAGSLAFGFGPLESVELNVSVASGRDAAGDPATRQRGQSFAVKWVPYQNDIGWSFGARFDYGRVRIEDRGTDATLIERETALTGLASWRQASGRVLHLNLGAMRFDTSEGDDTVGTWGLGFDLPLAPRWRLTLETFGAERARPDKAVGLRYALRDGLKLSAAVGDGNDRHFGQVAVAWEF